MTNTRKNPRTIWVEARAAELMASSPHWRAELALKRATKEWRLQSPQHLAAQRRTRDLARARYAPAPAMA
jgi:hypothetical protein